MAEMNPDWSALPVEIWSRILQYLNRPQEWTTLVATTKCLKPIVERFGYIQITGLGITLPSEFYCTPFGELQVHVGKMMYFFKYKLHNKLGVLPFLWARTPKLTKIAIQRLTEFIHIPVPDNDGYEEVTPKNPFLAVLQIIAKCNAQHPRQIISFTYAPVLTPPCLTTPDPEMSQILLSLLKQWKPFLKDLRVIDQGQHVAEWVDMMLPDNVLETVHVRTLPYRTPTCPKPPSFLANAPFLSNLGLNVLRRLTSTPDSKINNLALYISWDGVNQQQEVKACITGFLRSLTPQPKFTVTFPNFAYRTPRFLDFLGNYENPSQWQLGLNILDLGVDFKSFEFPYKFFNIFPNIHTIIGVPFQTGSFHVVKLLAHFALNEPTRTFDIRFKCHPTYEDEEEYNQVLKALPQWFFQLRHTGTYSMGFEDTSFKMVRTPASRQTPEVVTITTRHKASDHQRVVFSVPLYSKERVQKWALFANTPHEEILEYY
jgi:hypothetical protein